MGHIALYRAWRPQAFRDIVGQRPIMQTLQNALKEGRYSHAYLFSGPRGTGKTSAAKILAKALNCERGPAPEPCNECAACVGITEGTVLDVVEIDAASNRGVEEIRDIREKVKYAPTSVRHKVYIIDEVHMLTTEAFNALLKTLEEPPPHAVFILATTEPGRIPATIVSRCQRFDFRRISVEDQVERLARICREEGIEADGEALRLLAFLSEGGLRDALSMLDQVIAYSGSRLTRDDVLSVMGGIPGEQAAELAAALYERDVARVLDLADRLMQEGRSADKCLESLIRHYRDLLMVKLAPNAGSLAERVRDPDSLAGLAEQYDQERMFRIIETLNRFLQEMRYAAQPQLILEVALMKICAGHGPEAEQAVSPDAAGRAPAGDGAGWAPKETADLQAALEEMRRRVEALERRLEVLGRTGRLGAVDRGGPEASAQGMPASSALSASSAPAGFAAPAASPASRVPPEPSAMPEPSAAPESSAAPEFPAPVGSAAPPAHPEPVPPTSPAAPAGPAVPPFGPAASAAPPSRPAAKSSSAAAQAPAPPPDAAQAPRSPSSAAPNLKEFLRAADSPETREAQAKWPQVLQRLKDMNKMSLRAWLVNGEPVAATQAAVLVAFRSDLHRQTTEKPANREQIERVMHEVFGRPLSLATTMQNRWKELAEGEDGQAGQERPVLELVPEDPESAAPEEEWIIKAYELFGKDLVEIRDEKERKMAE